MVKGGGVMAVGARLRELRKQKGMSQGDVQHKTGLLRCYVSRVENGHTVPSVATLERLAAAFDVPLYRLFYEGEGPPSVPGQPPRKTLEELAKEPGKEGQEAKFLLKLRRRLAKVKQFDREVFLAFAQKLAASRR